MSKNFYVTTPIYYPSAKPHMGHAYSSIVADFFARFKRNDGYSVQFLTGTDEHGLKIQRSAEKKNIEPLLFCDEISETFRNLSSKLNLTNTDFIRTTEDRHKKSVQHLWSELEKSGDIYLSKYSGWYSVSDEAFYNEDEIEEIDGEKIAKSSKSNVEWMEEESFFFKLSKWQDSLLDYYEKNPYFISPESRKNEVISFVKSGLKDLSVSRKSFSWGIKVPNNNEHIIYVWLDALTNYISALNYPDKNNDLYKEFWPATIHLIGKDILRFHAIYWPAFLMAANLPLPKKVYGHGWILSDNEKMSKSKGNIVDPEEYFQTHGADSLRLYILFMAPPSDGVEWNDGGIEGTKRFLNKFWDNIFRFYNLEDNHNDKEEGLLRVLNQSIKSITDHFSNFEFNTVVSDLMKLNNEITEYLKNCKTVSSSTKNLVISSFTRLLHPLSPHISAEIYSSIFDKDVTKENWPKYDESYLTNPTFELVIQLNGKKKFALEVSTGITQDEAEKICKDNFDLVADEYSKIIFIKDKIINFVA